MIWWGWSGRVDYCPLPRPRDVRGEAQLGYGVIGNTTDSGSVILGSSPGTPADLMSHVDLLPPSFSGLGHRPLTAAAPVRIRLGVRGSGACSTARWGRHFLLSRGEICSCEGPSAVHQTDASRSLPVVTVSPRSSSERTPPSKAVNRASEGCVRPSWHSTTDPAPAVSLTAAASAVEGV